MGSGGGSKGKREMFDAVGSDRCHLVLMMRDWGGGGGSSSKRHKRNDIKLRRCTYTKTCNIFLFISFSPCRCN